jgi:hypothetical protein
MKADTRGGEPFTTWLPADVKEQLVRRAEAEDRSPSAVGRRFIRAGLADQGGDDE